MSSNDEEHFSGMDEEHFSGMHEFTSQSSCFNSAPVVTKIVPVNNCETERKKNGRHR